MSKIDKRSQHRHYLEMPEEKAKIETVMIFGKWGLGEVGWGRSCSHRN